MKELLQNRNFTLLWVGRLISLLGDWMLDVALPIWVYQLTGSAVALGTMVAIQQLPGIFLAPLVGVAVDRLNRKRVLTVVYALMGATILLLFTMETVAQLPIVYVVGFLNGVLGAFVVPARSALLPSLVPDAQLVRANSALALTAQISMLVGPALGGIVLGLAGPFFSFALDALSFFVAAILIAGIQVEVPLLVREKNEAGVRGVIQDIAEGLRAIRASTILTSTLAIWSILIFAGGAVAAVLVVFVREALGGSEATYGYLLSAQGLGMFIGGGTTMVLGERVKPIPAITGGLIAFAILFLIGANLSSVILAAIFVCAMGAMVALVGISAATLKQRAAPEAVRGRVLATDEAVASVMTLLGAVAGGLLAEQYGVRMVFNLAALLSLLAGFVALALLRPRQSLIDHAEMQPVEG